jgi:hypothetical protein
LKPLITKSDLRRELDRQIEAFVREGGRVNEIPRGISGRNPGEGMLPETPMISDKPKEDRTYVPEVVAGIEARRKAQHPEKKRPRRPRKKYIYDDFGEPIRWVWEE